MATESEKTWAAGAHLIPAVAAVLSLGTLGWIASIAVMLTKGRNSRFVRVHALQSMIFQFLLMILVLISTGILGMVPLLGGLLAGAIKIIAVVAGIGMPILGAGRAKQGREYAIPIAAQIAKSITG